jgi:putative FmdB family regulatory protein
MGRLGGSRVPLYEYQCDQCGCFEIIRKFSDPPLSGCPTCGKEVQKLFSSPAIQFKGSGWYVTDYARKSEGGKDKGASGDAGKDASSKDPGKGTSSKDTDKGTSSKDAGKDASSKPADTSSSSPQSSTSKDSSASGSSSTK